jgi:nucleoside-diphosphate-sugar epimerase
MDISRAKEFLSWEPRFTMERAFEDYIQDLKQAK